MDPRAKGVPFGSRSPRKRGPYSTLINKSLRNIRKSLNKGGGAILVVQDSYYKELHNDLPAIITEMAEDCGLSLRRREDFRMERTLAAVNPRVREYRKATHATEAVLCFSRGA